MGVSLIFKDADFSANAVNPDHLVNVPFTTSGYKWTYNDSSSVTNSFQYSTSLTSTKVCRADVSIYVGKRLKLTISWPSQYIADTTHVVRIVFASATKTFPPTGTSTVSSACTVVEQVKNYEEKPEDVDVKVFDLTVPTGAVYLVFSNNYSLCASPKLEAVV